MSLFFDNFDELGRDYTHLAIYKKGEEIFELVKQITDLIPEEHTELQYIKVMILNDALYLCSKVAGAEAADLYDIRMENAAIIRKAARDLTVSYHSLEIFEFEDAEYFDLVRTLIEEYRLLFIDWVKSFDQWNYIIDRWGLFNPPGVSPHDKDPDDDIPFENPFNDDND